jgi:hypothetical protein
VKYFGQKKMNLFSAHAHVHEQKKPLVKNRPKATKEDDAEVPIHLWNERVLQDWSKRNDQEDAGWKLETIRAKLLLQRWKQNLQRSLVAHLNEKFEVQISEKALS